VVDQQGIPLAVTLSAANTHDSQMMCATLDAIPAVRGRRGRPRCRPSKAHLDKGYDYARCRRALRQRGICPRIARRGVESSQRLGRHRWVVERTFAWLHAFRRLRVRYERRPDVHHAFLCLGCIIICTRFLQREF
jgi:transposase